MLGERMKVCGLGLLAAAGAGVLAAALLLLVETLNPLVVAVLLMLYGIYGAVLGCIVGLPGVLYAALVFPSAAREFGALPAAFLVALGCGVLVGVLAGGGAFGLCCGAVTVIGAVGVLLLVSPREKVMDRGWRQVLVFPSVALLVAVLVVVAVAAGGAEWLQSRSASPLDPTFSRYPREFMEMPGSVVGAQVLLSSLPYAIAVVLLFGPWVRRFGSWVAGVLLALGWTATAVVVAGAMWSMGLLSGLLIVLLGVGGVLGSVVAAGSCVVLRLFCHEARCAYPSTPCPLLG